MQIINKILCLIFLFSIGAAESFADDFVEKINILHALNINPGINELQIAGSKIIILNGAFQAESGGNRNCNSVLIEDSGDWYFARLKISAKDDRQINICANQHTVEDAVKTVKFYKDPVTQQLLLLILDRKISTNFLTPTKVNFNLYTLIQDQEFGTYYFALAFSKVSRKKYSSTEDAYEEEVLKTN